MQITTVLTSARGAAFNEKVSSLLDLTRWLSAFLVFAGHLRPLLFVDYPALENSNIFLAAFYFITGLSHQSVLVFFVLSGLLVGGEVVNKLKQEKFDFMVYSIRRFSRLYAVFPLALVLGCLLDWIGYTCFNQSGVYTHKILYFNVDVLSRVNFPAFLGNLFMLQGVYFPTLGSNSPLWSLANEFWYYLLFPLLAMAVTVKSRRIRIAVLLASCVIFFGIAHKLFWGFLIWLSGVLLWFLKKPVFKNPLIPLLLLLAALAVDRARIFKTLDPVCFDLLFGVIFMLLFNTILFFKDGKALCTRVNKTMAGFSYSLYLLHVPLIFFFLAILSQFKNIAIKMQPGFVSFALFFMCLALGYGYSYLVAVVTEKNTYAFREFLVRCCKKINLVR